MNSLETAQRQLGLKGYEMAAELRITPEWYSRLLRGKEELSDEMKWRLDDLLKRKNLKPALVSASGEKSLNKTGGLRSSGADGPQHTMVASRISPAPGAPSSRADCEAYLAELLDAAERSGNPNAFPVIHDRLKKKFPINEWEPHPDQT